MLLKDYWFATQTLCDQTIVGIICYFLSVLTPNPKSAKYTRALTPQKHTRSKSISVSFKTVLGLGQPNLNGQAKFKQKLT